MAGSGALSAGTVSLGVKPNAEGFGKTLSDSIKGQSAGIGEGLGETLMAGLKTLAAPLAALAVGLSIKHVVDDSVKAFEDLAGSVRSFQRIAGGSMEEVSGLRGAMQLAGVDADAASGALTIFSKKLGQTSGDAQATADMTARLGTSFTDATGAILPMSQILPGLADKFKEMPNGAEKTALATELFGRSGAQMIPVLNKGSEGIAELTAKAKDLGLVLDETSMNSFAESKKSARDFSAAIQGMKVTLGSDLLPVIDSVQNIFRNALTPAITGVTHFLQDHRQAFLDVAEAISDFGKKIQPVASAVSSFLGGAIAGAFSSIAGTAGSMMTALAPTFSAIGKLFQDLGPTFADLIPQLVQLMSAFSPIGLIFKALQPVLPQIVELIGQLAATLAGALGTALQAILPAITDVVTMLVTSLGGVVQQLLPTFTNLISILGPIFANVISQLVPMILNLINILGPIMQTVLNTLAPYWSILAFLIGQVFEAVMPLIPTVLGLVMAFVPLLEPIMQLVGQLLPPLIDMFKLIVVPIMYFAVAVLQGILIPVLQVVIGIITWIVQYVIPPLLNAFTGIASVVVSVFSGVVGFIKGIFNGMIDMVNGVFDLINPLLGSGPIHDFLGSIGVKVTHMNHIPHLAEGGIVPATNGGRLVRVAEGGESEAVIPLSKLKDMTGGHGGGQTIVYNAAPNTSISSEADLQLAIRRAKLVAGW